MIPFRRFGRCSCRRDGIHRGASITLIASAYDMAPDACGSRRSIETLIAMSIVYMALENIVVVRSARAGG